MYWFLKCFKVQTNFELLQQRSVKADFVFLSGKKEI